MMRCEWAEYSCLILESSKSSVKEAECPRLISFCLQQDQRLASQRFSTLNPDSGKSCCIGDRHSRLALRLNNVDHQERDVVLLRNGSLLPGSQISEKHL